MIVSFSVENYRSFKTEATLSLIASERISGDHEDHTVPIPDSIRGERVLRVAVLYGANGAGKSNLMKGLNFLRTLALGTRRRKAGTGREPFRFGASPEATSDFDLQFIANGALYRFGLKVNDLHISEEWLVRVKNDKETILYERGIDEHGSVVIESKGLRKAGKKVLALANVGGPPNQTFLATVNATVDVNDIEGELKDVLEWFNESFRLIEPDASFGAIGNFLVDSPDFLNFASEFLRGSSTGIRDLIVSKRPISEEALFALLPAPLASRVREDLNGDDSASTLIGLPDGCELLIEPAGDDHYYQVTIQATHENDSGQAVPIDFTEESDGTRRLLDLLPALHHLKSLWTSYVIDEIDRSMHPMLVWTFIRYFLASPDTNRSQMIVTTHESNLLDLELLRRDEIWFAQKDQHSSTQIYSLSDYKVRKDLEIRKHYLQGRFGAVPFLGDLDRLVPEQAE